MIFPNDVYLIPESTESPPTRTRLVVHRAIVECGRWSFRPLQWSMTGSGPFFGFVFEQGRVGGGGQLENALSHFRNNIVRLNCGVFHAQRDHFASLPPGRMKYQTICFVPRTQVGPIFDALLRGQLLAEDKVTDSSSSALDVCFPTRCCRRTYGVRPCWTWVPWSSTASRYTTLSVG